MEPEKLTRINNLMKKYKFDRIDKDFINDIVGSGPGLPMALVGIASLKL